MHQDFVYATDVIPAAREEIRYAGSHNFVGRPIDGYLAPRAVLTREAALALRCAADAFARLGLYLLIYDAYRPQRAVDHFARWAKDPLDNAMQAEFYPELKKDQLFPLGYIAARSGHSRGSTVDLTLTDGRGAPLDMGGTFDRFGRVSSHDYAALTPAQKENRLLLKAGMEAAGFKPYSEEWWHYTLKGEPFPDTYFDFPVK